MEGPTRETKVGGHTVRITGRVDDPRPFRGFFAGDDLPSAHHEAEHGPEALPEELPPDLTVIEVDGARFDVHRLPAGFFHTHQLPFQRFESIDQIVDQIVRLMDNGALHGRP